MDDRFVDAYDKKTGDRCRVPAHWLDHPTLGKPFRKTPKPHTGGAAAAPSATPVTDVVTSTPANPPTTAASTTETPAAGAKE